VTLGRRSLLSLLAAPLMVPALAPAALAARSGPRLAAPFDAQRIRARAVAARQSASCPVPSAAVRDINGVPIYADAQGSRVDPERRAENEQVFAPLRGWLSVVQQPTEAWLRGGDVEEARCALRHMLGWARDNALLGSTNAQGGYQRKWTVSGAALNFLVLRDVPGLPADQLDAVAEWLERVARAVIPVYERPPRPGNISPARNNHAYWAGLAVAACGIAAGERRLLNWGIERAHIGLSQVEADGSLPLEMARGGMALSYHLFSLGPLAALERIAAANGMALSASDVAALDRLVAFVVEGIAEPGRVEARVGRPQIHSSRPAPPSWREAVGLEIRNASRPIPAAEPHLAGLRPLRQPWLGGNVTLLWS
jgi:poly(beta-D-mannuronate) lyase